MEWTRKGYCPPTTPHSTKDQPATLDQSDPTVFAPEVVDYTAGRWLWGWGCDDADYFESDRTHKPAIHSPEWTPFRVRAATHAEIFPLLDT